MKATLSKAAALFQAPLSKAARTVAALQDKREKTEGGAPSAAASDGDAPSAAASDETSDN